MKKSFIGCLLFLLSVAAFTQNNYSFPVQVKITNGLIEGKYDTKTNLEEFFGIPYAKPPVGELRWRAPQPLDNWSGVLETKKFAPRAVQPPVFGDMIFRSADMSEDCLYLNVWAPASSKMQSLPVLVYFYGGGFLAGDGSEPRYDGASMAGKGIVVVTVNYRLNIFGFFAHPELSSEVSTHSSGNYGLLDQVAALKWVQNNIASFGGNPSRVTIAGESAGSISVSAQMASPLSRGLFEGAIGESGASIKPTLNPVPLATAENLGLDFAKKAGGYSLKQLRSMSTAQIYSLYLSLHYPSFPPVIDGYFLKNTLPETFKTGEQVKVPLLLGWNSAEVPGIALLRGKAFTAENYQQAVKRDYPDDYEAILKLYPFGSEKEIENSATALASDRFIVYSTWKWFDLQRNYSDQPVYRYLFARVRPPLAGDTSHMPLPDGARHSVEIEYCMGNLSITPYAWTADDRKVSATMQDYFANFIKTGNPNGNGLPDWPAATKGDVNPDVMRIDVDSKAFKAQNEDRYLLLDKIFGNQ